MSAGRLVVDGAGPVSRPRGRPRKTWRVSAGRLVVDGAGPVGRPRGRPRRPGLYADMHLLQDDPRNVYNAI